MARVTPEILGIDSELWKKFLRTFKGDDAQDCLEYLKKNFFFYKSTYEGNKDEALINEGSRRVLLTIETIMKMRFVEGTSEPIGGEDE